MTLEMQALDSINAHTSAQGILTRQTPFGEQLNVLECRRYVSTFPLLFCVACLRIRALSKDMRLRDMLSVLDSRSLKAWKDKNLWPV